MPIDWSGPLVEVIEKAALLRQEIDRRGDQEAYAARVNRLGAKIDLLCATLAETEPALASEIKMAWQRPVRTLAFRNAQRRRDKS
jgi:hypothetical protein